MNRLLVALIWFGIVLLPITAILNLRSGNVGLATIQGLAFCAVLPTTRSVSRRLLLSE